MFNEEEKENQFRTRFFPTNGNGQMHLISKKKLKYTQFLHKSEV